MLSERQLAAGFADLWRYWTPRLGPAFLASLREGGEHQGCVSRWAAPLASEVPARDNDLIAEIAFGLFFALAASGRNRKQRPFLVWSAQLVDSLIEASLARLALLRGSEELPRQWVSAAHLADCKALATRLYEHLAGFDETIEVHQRLEGIGMLNACHPDVLQGRSLVEVKMSKSSFRTVDLRQALVYAAMAHGHGIELDELALINPRLGLSWRFTLEGLVDQIAGTTPARLFDSIIRFVTDGLPRA